VFFRIIAKDRLPDLVRGLATEYEVVGPVEKGGTHVFARIDDPADLTLDYETTILPPKKWFFPPEETMMRFRVAERRRAARCTTRTHRR